MGKYAKKRHHHRVLDQKKAHRTRRRATDVDQISCMLLNAKTDLNKLLDKKNVDIVGKGEHFCAPCNRHFMNPNDLEKHERSKPHKKRLKYLGEPQYSHEEAAAAGGLGSYRVPDTPIYPINLSLMTTRHKETVEQLQDQFTATKFQE